MFCTRLHCIVIKLLASTAITSTLTGCATLVEGSAQTIQIITEPAGAYCILKRETQLVTVIPSTPATISIFKEDGQLILRCNKHGYLEATWEAGSGFQDMVFGNILLGGIIGAAVDAGSGAMYKYPESIQLTLIPERFDNESERDIFFAEWASRVNQEAQDSIHQARTSCDDADCEKHINMLEDERNRSLNEIESKRQEALVER